jgi:hypothetical protein
MHPEYHDLKSQNPKTAASPSRHHTPLLAMCLESVFRQDLNVLVHFNGVAKGGFKRKYPAVESS